MSDSQQTAAAETKPRRASVSAEKFIPVFIRHQQAGNGAKEIAEELGMDQNGVSVKASGLRKMGIPLPQLSRPGGCGKLDVSALTALVEGLLPASKPKTDAEGDGTSETESTES